MLSYVEPEKSFITSEPGPGPIKKEVKAKGCKESSFRNKIVFLLF